MISKEELLEHIGDKLRDAEYNLEDSSDIQERVYYMSIVNLYKGLFGFTVTSKYKVRDLEAIASITQIIENIYEMNLIEKLNEVEE